MFIIPNQETKKHLQTNINDLSGTIFKSRNIDLDDEGYIRLAQGSYAETTEEDDADLTSANAIFPSENSIWVAGGEVFDGDMNLSQFSNNSTDTNAPQPSTEDDVIFFNDTEVVSVDGDIKYRSAATTWTTVSTNLSNTTPSCMTVWDSEDVLAVGSDNEVKFVDSAWAVSGTTLTLPAGYQVSSMDTNGSTLYIGTRNKSGGEAKLFLVSTIQTTHDTNYGVGTFEIMSVKKFNSSVALIVSNGQLLRFNGGGFSSLAQLPIYNKDISWSDALNDYSRVANRSMFVDGDLIYVNISGDTEQGKLRVLPDFPAGVWCYDLSTGSFYHRYSPSYTRVQKVLGSSVTVDTTDNDFTLTSGSLDSDVITGQPVLFDDGSGTLIPELKQSTTYYIIKDSSTVFRLATSYDNAIAGTEIDITDAGNISQDWYIFKTNDYGWTELDDGAGFCTLNNKLYDDNFVGRACITSDLNQKQATTGSVAICGISPFIPNRGYFVTPRLNSSAIEEAYNNVYIKYKPLGDSDKIIVKYKDVDKKDYPFASKQLNVNSKWTGSWTSTTVFTTTADLSDVVAGEEIEVVSGVGSGHIANISTITELSGTYTVTLEESFPFAVSGDIMTFNVDNWKEIDGGTITTSTECAENGYYKLSIGKMSKFLQIKVEMRGIGVTVEELIINNKPHKPVV